MRPCHATGYDSEKKTYKEENVGCEACHGPGEKYQEMMTEQRQRRGGRSRERMDSNHVPDVIILTSQKGNILTWQGRGCFLTPKNRTLSK